MADITEDQVLAAAAEFGGEEFSRPSLAEKLGVDKSEMKKAFRAARQSGKLEKVRNDAENVSWFKLNASS